MNIIAIIQARMGSTRLPGKVMKEINGIPILDYVVRRTYMSNLISDVLIATSTSKNDDIIVEYAIKNEVPYYRGSEDNVLNRYYNAAKCVDADIIVRITGDAPLIDPDIIDEVINAHLNSDADYTSNTLIRSYPRGLDVEVFNFSALEKSYKNATTEEQFEHVVVYIHENKNGGFILKNIKARGKLNRPDIRLTVDTQEDFDFIEKILCNYSDMEFRTKNVIEFLNRNPELLEINKNIKQKEYNYKINLEGVKID